MGSRIEDLSAKGRELFDALVRMFGRDRITVTSTRRPNDAGSQHQTGDAIDFQIGGLTNAQVQAVVHASGIPYGQLINEVSGPESTGPHVHLSSGTRRQLLRYQNGSYIPVSSAELAANMPQGVNLGASAIAGAPMVTATGRIGGGDTVDGPEDDNIISRAWSAITGGSGQEGNTVEGPEDDGGWLNIGRIWDHLRRPLVSNPIGGEGYIEVPGMDAGGVGITRGWGTLGPLLIPLIIGFLGLIVIIAGIMYMMKGGGEINITKGAKT